ncbi:hypothetical protein DUNSADRAFT_18760 [Dunaliella salina]|uniref:Uncharacterized protein n=1 Tax=Dunaliella salina TaxID=3046 RepID=A0ABQ7FZL7_DUNSA|nr:hypothetical protein DUNSADRAFT_18760 [Dunaliella salina]|eukprot:KAF5827791.1 hypothetical protein DUNSADRAFT_18760 [Dunaliella salina]
MGGYPFGSPTTQAVHVAAIFIQNCAKMLLIAEETSSWGHAVLLCIIHILAYVLQATELLLCTWSHTDSMPMIRSGYIVEEEDLPWVMALFSQHPRFESKLHNWNGTVSCEFSHGNYHFALHKHGEGWEDISYKRCLSAKASKGNQDVFRTAVADQISSFKRKVFRQSKVICPETGEQLSWSICAIDHVAASGASFADLIRGFLAPKNLREVEITSIQKPGTLFNNIADPVLKEEWRAYHAEHAVLRPVSRRWNDAEGFQKRRK